MRKSGVSVDGKTPPEFAPDLPSDVDRPPIADKTTMQGLRDVIIDDQNRIRGIIDLFHEHFGGPTIAFSDQSGPYPDVYVAEDETEYPVVDDDGNWWTVNSGPDTNTDSRETNLMPPEEAAELYKYPRESATETVEPDDDEQQQLTDFADRSDHADEYVEQPVPCDYERIRSCECCLCPECHNKSIRARKNKEPEFACNNPNCPNEFDTPVHDPRDN